MTEICANIVTWRDAPEVIAEGTVYVCELAGGHEGAHQDGEFRWVDGFESFDEYLEEYHIGESETPQAFKQWMETTTGWDGDT